MPPQTRLMKRKLENAQAASQQPSTKRQRASQKMRRRSSSTFLNRGTRRRSSFAVMEIDQDSANAPGLGEGRLASDEKTRIAKKGPAVKSSVPGRTKKRTAPKKTKGSQKISVATKRTATIDKAPTPKKTQKSETPSWTTKEPVQESALKNTRSQRNKSAPETPAPKKTASLQKRKVALTKRRVSSNSIPPTPTTPRIRAKSKPSQATSSSPSCLELDLSPRRRSSTHRSSLTAIHEIAAKAAVATAADAAAAAAASSAAPASAEALKQASHVAKAPIWPVLRKERKLRHGSLLTKSTQRAEVTGQKAKFLAGQDGKGREVWTPTTPGNPLSQACPLAPSAGLRGQAQGQRYGRPKDVSQRIGTRFAAKWRIHRSEDVGGTIWYVDRYNVRGRETLEVMQEYVRGRTEQDFGCGRGMEVKIRAVQQPIDDGGEELLFGEMFVGYDYRGQADWRPIILGDFDGNVESDEEDSKDARKQIASWWKVNRESHPSCSLKGQRLIVTRAAAEIGDSEQDSSTVERSPAESFEELTLDEYKQLHADMLEVSRVDPPLSATDSDFGEDRDFDEDNVAF